MPTKTNPTKPAGTNVPAGQTRNGNGNGNHAQVKEQIQNTTQAKEQNTQVQQTNTQAGPEAEIRKLLQDLKQKSIGSDEWLSERIIEGDYYIVTASARNGDLVLWIKPRTLRNGVAIVLDAQIKDRIEDMEWIVNQLKSLMPILSEFAGISRRTVRTEEGRIIIRKRM